MTLQIAIGSLTTSILIPELCMLRPLEVQFQKPEEDGTLWVVWRRGLLQRSPISTAHRPSDIFGVCKLCYLLRVLILERSKFSKGLWKTMRNVIRLHVWLSADGLVLTQGFVRLFLKYVRRVQNPYPIPPPRQGCITQWKFLELRKPW